MKILFVEKVYTSYGRMKSTGILLVGVKEKLWKKKAGKK